MIFSSLIKKEEYLETESRFNRYFSSRAELEETDSSNEAYSNISLTASRHINSFLSLKEEDKDKDTFSLFFFDETKNELLSPSKEKEKEKKNI